MTKKDKYCPQCGSLMWNDSTLCYRCSKIGINNAFFNKKHSIKTKKRISKSHFKHGGKGKCIDCKTTIYIRAKRCKSCSAKKQHKDNIFDYHRKPTKPEIIVTNLLPKSFKYVGNNKLSVTTYNPDFINTKEKKIIEMFGDYWHNRKEQKQKDRIKLTVYHSLGYRTLIIWEKETKNIKLLKKKINNFIKKANNQ
jgi:G:T-mismatch repair DNA endonuclease (very short patch repair protein)